MSVTIKFLGGAEKVGSLGMLLETWGKRLLFDYGLTPTDPPEYPLPAPRVDRVFLTHAHVDHSGMIPWLCGHKDAIVHTVPPTIDVSLLLAEDSNKICGIEGYPQPYDKHDIAQAEMNFRPLRYGQTKRVGDIDVIPRSAGHIPGAAMYEIHGEEVMLFTGDINTTPTRLVEGAEPVRCDVLFMESTYAGREHPPREKVEYDFLAKVEEVVDRGGKVIAPAFAVGRTQEILLLLRGQGYDVWVDGMGKTITGIYQGYGGYVRDVRKLSKAMGEAKKVRGPKGRKMAMKGEVIVTTSGMLDGGPVLQYVEALKDDPKSAILLTGYQVEGTNGRLLMDTGTLDISGVREKIKMEVDFYDLSAHAGHKELVEFARETGAERVVLMHGDNREALAEDISDFAEVYLPRNGEVLRL
ncbi:MAG: MBL fold metallo-hydrolase [Thermoplasmata archaeon]|nr:MBL fold metallo-hydrolase [Thermoplasmata archaeon]